MSVSPRRFAGSDTTPTWFHLVDSAHKAPGQLQRVTRHAFPGRVPAIGQRAVVPETKLQCTLFWPGMPTVSTISIPMTAARYLAMIRTFHNALHEDGLEAARAPTSPLQVVGVYCLDRQSFLETVPKPPRTARDTLVLILRALSRAILLLGLLACRAKSNSSLLWPRARSN